MTVQQATHPFPAGDEIDDMMEELEDLRMETSAEAEMEDIDKEALEDMAASIH
ncbi:MAG: hypothetical protein HQL54_01155 [Magnetococcales bacterium]|nr:hypothetical protein [Magnetococcales bacterium]